MGIKSYSATILLGTLIFWGAWFAITVKTNPEAIGAVGFAMFYGALFMALVGTFSLVGLALRKIFMKNELSTNSVSVSFRQSFSFALLIVLSLFLQSNDLLYVWNIAILVAILLLLELAILLIQKR